MNDQSEDVKSSENVVNRVANKLNADVIYYNGPILRPTDMQLIDECIKRSKRKNVLLILVTQGGDADVAYRIARCLQTKYERFFLYVSGYCKSAGTLVALGAHELIMSDHGELGPLDVQLSKKDELWETQSGLTVMDTLKVLQSEAFKTFKNYFLETKVNISGSITLKTAAQIATELTTGLFAPLYGQVDPLHIGETGRSMAIATQYGLRLIATGRNIGLDELEQIVSEYPSHGFVIDRHEACVLFNNVREPDADESLLTEELGNKARWPYMLSEQLPFKFLLSPP